ncbi:MAG TPA: hypothetical protein VFB76_02755 [Candidatus Angelobacter sp.]|nr:hypothetical protein [Candidatus Angelobacter sp.]
MLLGDVLLEAAELWSGLVLGVVLVEAVELGDVDAAEFWSGLVLGVVLEAAELGVVEVVELWSALVLGVVLLEAVLLGIVLLLEAELWSVELGVCAGGFTGELALSGADPAGFDVVAAGALALFVSVVGVWLLPAVTGVLLLLAAVLLWSGDVLDAAAPVVAEVAAPVAAPPMLA